MEEGEERMRGGQEKVDETKRESDRKREGARGRPGRAICSLLETLMSSSALLVL